MALAQEPVTCDTSALTAVPETVSVAWITPVRRRATGRSWLEVVRTADLQEALKARGKPSTGRMLQLLGQRRRASEPTRRYKVTIFEARAADLCRPIHGLEPPDAAGGLGACPPRFARPGTQHDGCGATTDRATGGRGVEHYRIRWRDAAVRGFCVLPADRFVEQR